LHPTGFTGNRNKHFIRKLKMRDEEIESSSLILLIVNNSLVAGYRPYNAGAGFRP
jgi:hypothetical protein